jgi:hypothetical protein
MNISISIAIKRDFPEFADEIVAAARSDPGLMDALKDYEQACERMIDTRAQPEDRALWIEIRAELAAEIRRLYLVQIRDGNSSAN